MERPSCVEWANGMRVVTVELRIYGWSSSLLRRLGIPTYPTTVGYRVRCRRVIYQLQAVTLADGDSGLSEILIG